jgi:serine protease AprX
MWYYPAAGGPALRRSGTNGKPDVTAPTPRNGKVVYGGDLKVLPDGWGTSGACPQAAAWQRCCSRSGPTSRAASCST